MWEVNPGLFGWDPVTVGAGIYQPLRFPGQLYDEDSEAHAYLSPTTYRLRPGISHNRFRSYDSFTGGYLQVDPMVDSTWDAYGYVEHNPVMNVDPQGLATYDECIAYQIQFESACDLQKQARLVCGKGGLTSCIAVAIYQADMQRARSLWDQGDCARKVFGAERQGETLSCESFGLPGNGLETLVPLPTGDIPSELDGDRRMPLPTANPVRDSAARDPMRPASMLQLHSPAVPRTPEQ